MDSIASALLDAIASAVEQSKKGPQTGSPPLGRPPAGTPQRGQAARATATSASKPAHAAQRIQPAAPEHVEPRRHPHPRLLRAFRPASNLLGAFILTEALSPPLALRAR